jgi:outer membrane immunogenic protein
MRKLAIAGITLVTVGLAGSALGADMPVKAPLYKAPPPPVYTWTGCYVGGHVGGGWVRDDETNAGAINSANFPFGTTRTNDGSGVIGGVQGGCNYQFAPVWLVGFEGDFTWANIKATSDTAGLVNPTVVNHVNENYRWLSDITARFGFIAADSLLVYVKGGVAWVHQDGGSNTTNAAGAVLDVISGSATRAGWLIGGGGEFRIAPNWSVKVEYNFIDFKQTLGSTVDFGANAPVSTGVTLLREHDTRVQTLKVGINYLFGGPVVARY